jgi:hypothetical protein
MVFIVDYVASALLKVNTTTDSQEVIRIFENASAGAQRVQIILLAVVIASIAKKWRSADIFTAQRIWRCA